MKRINIPLTALLIISLTACNLPSSGSPTATDVSVPTSTAASPPTETVSAAEPSPTVEGDVVLEAILILSPGSNSTITSPVTVTGQSRPTFEQNLVLAVYGEDGSLLIQQPTIIQSDNSTPGPFTSDLSFTVDHEQPGRVSVFETSAMDGGIVHLSSVEVTLGTGVANIVPAIVGFESISIESPLPNMEISGGFITITGMSDYYFESQLVMVLCGGGDGGGAADPLCGEAHNVLGGGVAMINSPDMGQPGPFSGTLTWSVSGPTPGRIIVYATSPRDGGLVHVASIPVLILP